jgi:hypothetical protein
MASPIISVRTLTDPGKDTLGSSGNNYAILASHLWKSEAALPSQNPQNTPSIPPVFRHQTHSIFLKPERDLGQLIP